MKLLLVSAFVLAAVVAVSCQTTDSSSGPPGGPGGRGPGGPMPPLAAALEPLGLRKLERMVIRGLRSLGKTPDQMRPLLDGLATDVKSIGTDRAKVLERIEKFASDNGLGSIMSAAIATAKSASSG